MQRIGLSMWPQKPASLYPYLNILEEENQPE